MEYNLQFLKGVPLESCSHVFWRGHHLGLVWNMFCSAKKLYLFRIAPYGLGDTRLVWIVPRSSQKVHPFMTAPYGLGDTLLGIRVGCTPQFEKGVPLLELHPAIIRRFILVWNMPCNSLIIASGL